MDLLTIIKLALFVPFFLMFAIFAVVYLINGYKKDLGRSLISLLATAVSVLVSLLLAKLVGWGLSKPISALLPIPAEHMGALGASFIKGVIEIVLSFMFFFLFFIISLALLKSVGRKINLGKLEVLNAGKGGTRAAGMAIRLVDALLVTVMFLLPFYGTVAMVAPPAAALVRMSEMGMSSRVPSLPTEQTAAPNMGDSLPIERMSAPVKVTALPGVTKSSDEPGTAQILDTLANHPVLLPYKYGPGAWAYSGLTSFSMNGKTVNVATAASSLEGLLDRVEKFVSAVEAENAEASMAAMSELIDFARDEVISQKWSYDMVMAFVGEIDVMYENYEDELSINESLRDTYSQLRPLFDLTFEEYTYNAEGLLDFAGWFLERCGKYLLGTEPSAMELLSIQKETYEHLGDLLNHSEQAVALKRMILQQIASDMLYGIPDKSASAFVNKYYGDGFVNGDKERIREANSFFWMLEGPSALDIAEAFARNPLFGADAVIEYCGNAIYDEVFGPNLAAHEKAEEVYEKLNAMLKAYESAPYYQPLTFSSAARAYVYGELHIGGGGYTSDFYFSEDVLSSIRIMEGEDGKMYIVPSDVYGEIGDMETLDADTVKKYNLKSIDEFASENGFGNIVEGDTVYKEFSVSGSEGGSYFVKFE